MFSPSESFRALEPELLDVLVDLVRLPQDEEGLAPRDGQSTDEALGQRRPLTPGQTVKVEDLGGAMGERLGGAAGDHDLVSGDSLDGRD